MALRLLNLTIRSCKRARLLSTTSLRHTDKGGSNKDLTPDGSGKEIVASGKKTRKIYASEDVKDAIQMLKDEFARMTTEDTDPSKPDKLLVPRHSDVVIIGGGAIGSAVAFWLAHRGQGAYQIRVIERDPCYTRAATVLSLGGLRQQFSLKENIQMSLFTAEFLRNIKEYLSIYGEEPPDINFNPQGYLFMSTEQSEDTLRSNHRLQTSLGAKVDLMTPDKLKEKFPWLNTDGLALAGYGLKNEGWFDPWALLCAMRKKAQTLGVEYIKGEVVGFDHRTVDYNDDGMRRQKRILDSLQIKAEDGLVYPMKFATVMNCAGPWAGEVAQMAGIGTPGAQDANIVPLPIEPRKRYVFVFHCPDGPGLDMPMMIDPTGVYVRREGINGYYVCGVSPPKDQEPDTSELTVDYDFFTEHIWPVLAYRIPAFECLKLKSAWAGYYDYNYFDQNLIIGNHPYFNNMVIAAGCSGHGIQQAPAIGRAVTELFLDSEYTSIDLSRFSFDRILDDEPIVEVNIV